jgi:hypothetical protein
MLASGGIPYGSRVQVVATGVDKHGQALEFFYTDAPELLQQAQELRAAEVGRTGVGGLSDTPPQPSVGLSADRGHTLEQSAGPLGARGPRLTPRRNDGR